MEGRGSSYQPCTEPEGAAAVPTAHPGDHPLISSIASADLVTAETASLPSPPGLFQACETNTFTQSTHCSKEATHTNIKYNHTQHASYRNRALRHEAQAFTEHKHVHRHMSL